MQMTSTRTPIVLFASALIILLACVAARMLNEGKVKAAELRGNTEEVFYRRVRRQNFIFAGRQAASYAS